MDTGVQGESLHGRQNRIVPRIHYPPFKKADFNRQPFFCSFYNGMKLYYAPASQYDIHQLYAAPLTTRLAFHIYMSLQLETDHNLIRFTGDKENLSHPLHCIFQYFYNVCSVRSMISSCVALDRTLKKAEYPVTRTIRSLCFSGCLCASSSVSLDTTLYCT